MLAADNAYLASYYICMSTIERKKEEHANKTLSENEIRKLFRKKLPTIQNNANELICFVDICTSWIKGIIGAINFATKLGPTETSIPLDKLLLDVEDCYSERLKQAQSDLLVIARDSNCLDEIQQKLQSAIQSLRNLMEIAVAPAVAIGFTSKQQPSLLEYRRQLLSDLDELTAMSRLLGTLIQKRPLLTEQQELIWNLLKGRALVSKEIVMKLDYGTSEDTVRKQILRMRRKGRKIITARSVGYYREDAPPPKLV